MNPLVLVFFNLKEVPNMEDWKSI